MASTGVRDWYSGKNVFITGGSGFLGVALLEKLLRTVPDLGDVYLLLRPKKGKEIHERLDEIKTNLIFEKLYESRKQDEVFARVKAIAGDVSEENLGLSTSDRHLLTSTVDIIFHSAATLDFSETLKTTVRVNLLGTRRVVQLARDCSRLKVFVHVSSAYVNSWRTSAEEVVYPLTDDPERLISLVATLSDEELERETPKILGDHPNTYTITKHMAEHEVQKVQAEFPCAIVRPSMIIGAWKEPVPGWTISKNGPQGFLMGASKGVVRRLPVGVNLIYDYIPVDVVVNELIVAAFHASVTNAKTVEVFHCTTSTRNPFRWAAVQDRINAYLHRFPLKSAVWYPHLKFVPSVARFRFSAFFVHFVPAFILDTVTRVAGGKPILMRLHRNVNASLDRLETFIFTEWSFQATKTMDLHRWLGENDREDFSLDVKALDWGEYFSDLTLGARRYLSKEHPRNLGAARSKDMILMVLHLLLQAALLSLVWYVFACVVGGSMTKTAMIVPVAYMLFNLI